MTRTTFSFPTPTLFGPDSISELPIRLPKLGINRALIVTDAGLLKTSAFETLKKTLGSEDEGKTWFRLQHVNGFWAVAFANPHAGWLVGTEGRIVKISF